CLAGAPSLRTAAPERARTAPTGGVEPDREEVPARPDRAASLRGHGGLRPNGTCAGVRERGSDLWRGGGAGESPGPSSVSARRIPGERRRPLPGAIEQSG